MRILLVAKDSSPDSSGGEDVFDRKILIRLQHTHEVIKFTPVQNTTFTKFFRLFTAIPLYRATYYSRANIDGLTKSIEENKPDLVIVSWEPFDFLVKHIEKKLVLILHNVTSDAITEVFGSNGLSRLYAPFMRLYESKVFSYPQLKAIITLSRRDSEVVKRSIINLRRSENKPLLEVVNPGAPPVSSPPAPELRRELLISGTYNWYPKRRDLRRALKRLTEIQQFGFTTFWDQPLPLSVAQHHSDNLIDTATWSPVLRFGLVPDTFASGFKLKTTSYIVNNCIVLSLAPIESDYADLPHSNMFLRMITDLRQIEEIYTELSSIDTQVLANLFVEFKDAVVKRFNWDAEYDKLDQLLMDVARL